MEREREEERRKGEGVGRVCVRKRANAKLECTSRRGNKENRKWEGSKIWLTSTSSSLVGVCVLCAEVEGAVSTSSKRSSPSSTRVSESMRPRYAGKRRKRTKKGEREGGKRGGGKREGEDRSHSRG